MARTTTESPADCKKRLHKIGVALTGSMPKARMELDHRSPWELLVATILSAQCTDQRVNQVTPKLFERYPTAADLAAARLADVEQIIRSTGFFKSKAKNIVGCSRVVATQFKGKVPETIEELVTLPGVGRKTANVLLGNVFGRPAIIVDTHVKRVSNRLGLTRSDDPDRIEEDLQRLLPSAQWTEVSQRLLLHGRYVCTARAPQCRQCSIYTLCPWKEKRSL
jgi:endonuclease-3